MKNILSVLAYEFKNRKNHKAVSFLASKKLVHQTWTQILEKALQFEMWLKKQKISDNKPIVIIAHTRFEWVYMELVALKNKLAIVPLSPSISNSDLKQILSEIKPELIICEHEFVANRSPILELIEKPKTLLMDSTEFKNIFIETIKQDLDSFFAGVEEISPTTLTTVIYTSGTSGQPKGVCLTHQQILSCITNVFAEFNIGSEDTTITFLPFSHVLGRIELWGSIYYGFCLGFATTPDSLKNDIKIIQPTVMVGVPRIFEKIYFGILAQVSVQGLSKKIFHKSLDIAMESLQLRQSKKDMSLLKSIALGFSKFGVLSNVKNKLGGKLKFAVSGGAPLSNEIINFFYACGIPIFQGYGLTETTGPIAVNTPFNAKIGSVGKPIKGVTVRFAPDGEILVKGDQIFANYYNHGSTTKDHQNENGYFCTGDIGKLDDEGFLFITDRKKDLIKTSGGKFVAPQKIQNLLKSEPLISYSLIYGDEKKYIVALVTIDKGEYNRFCDFNGLDSSKPPSQYIKLIEKIKTAIAYANSQLSSFETVKNFKILDTDFSVETGEITASLKIKRTFCTEKYRKQLEELY